MKQQLLFVLLLIVIIILIIREQYTIYEKFTCGYEAETAPYTKPQIIENVITPEDAEYIMNYAHDKFTLSGLVGTASANESIRKSETCWLPRDDPIARKLIERVCAMANKPFENAEDLQIVRYKPNGFYKPHHDSCCDTNKACEDFIKRGGQRVVTLVVYLNDAFGAGETNFPSLGLKIKAPKYGGVLFYPMNEDKSKCHPLALHEGTEITYGEKMICNVWVRDTPFIK
jgi:prolyl 4-hydroxylase